MAATTMWRSCASPETTMNVCRRDSKQFHVLAVDDSNIDRKVIERLLKISSCKVTVVDSGNRALQYLGLDEDDSSVKYDDLKVNLIMTDYSMPGMTGFELLKKIKKSTNFREVPVVIMSSENILTRIDRCLEEGAEDFLLKPVKLSDVERLKDFILKGEEGEDDEEVEAINKRKRADVDSLSAASQLPSLVDCDLLMDMPSSPASQTLQSLSKRAKL